MICGTMLVFFIIDHLFGTLALICRPTRVFFIDDLKYFNTRVTDGTWRMPILFLFGNTKYELKTKQKSGFLAILTFIQEKSVDF